MIVREAERDAERLLASSWWTTSDSESRLPIDPFQIARRYGIKVRYTFLPPDESGKIVISPSGSEITLNAADSTNRQRFTCAHEIGHYYRRLQQSGGQLGASKTFVDRRAQLASAGTDPDEIYANQFAAALLMPATLVARGRRMGESPDTLAWRFGTSTIAMQLRLRNLNLG